MPRMVLLMLVVFGFGVAKIKWNYGCYCRSSSVLHSFSAVFRLLRDRGSWSLKPSWATLISSRRLLYWTPARAVLISYASSGWVSVKLRLLCLPQFTTSVLINARQVFELTIRFVLYSVFSTTTCESFDLYNTTTKFNFDFVFEGKTEFLLFLERHNRLKSDGKISEISQNEQEIWLRIFFKT